jgi:hypothetical protein
MVSSKNRDKLKEILPLIEKNLQSQNTSSKTKYKVNLFAFGAEKEVSDTKLWTLIGKTLPGRRHLKLLSRLRLSQWDSSKIKRSLKRIWDNG